MGTVRMNGEADHLYRFLSILDWLLAMHVRHPAQMQFGILHVCFHEQQRLGMAYGAPAAHHMLNELATHLRQEFRRTDLVARDGTDFWVLVPYTEPATVQSKVVSLVEAASRNGLSIVDRDVAFFTLHEDWCDDANKRYSAKDFLAYIKANRHIAVSMHGGES